MINYFEWPRRKLTVTSLKLDDQNPRLSVGSDKKRPSQPQIIEYLVEYERAYELAQSIAIQGYLINEEPVVCKEGNKFIVLEGNRRVAALKILINPDILKSSARRKRIKELLEDFDIKLILKLGVFIAPNRKSADVLIVNRHTEGSAIEKWDKTKQDRFLHNRFASGENIQELSKKFNIKKKDIKGTLMRHNVYQELVNLTLSETEQKDLRDETKFSMTNVERFYLSQKGKEFLGIDFNEEGDIIHTLPIAEYNKRLKRIAVDVINKKLNSRTYGDANLQTAYITKLNQSSDFDLKIKPDPKFQKEYSTKGTKGEATPIVPKEAVTGIFKTAAKNKLIPKDIKWVTGIARIDNIFKEMKGASLTSQFNSASILFRCYLDMILYQYLNKHKAIDAIKILEQKALDENNKKQLDNAISSLIKMGFKEESIDTKEIKKLLRQSKGFGKEWVPSLKRMLSYLASEDKLLPDVKLRQALGSYIKGSDGFLGHNDFNLIVHNEYYIHDGEGLKKVWEKMQPILLFINEDLASK